MTIMIMIITTTNLKDARENRHFRPFLYPIRTPTFTSFLSFSLFLSYSRFLSLSLSASLRLSLSFMFQQYPQDSISVPLNPSLISTTVLSHFVRLLLLLLYNWPLGC
jgi:hypothetical protein